MKITFTFVATLLFVFSFSSSLTAKSNSCYVTVEKSANLDPAIIQDTTIPILNKYVDAVEAIPLGGIRSNDCRYTVSLTESEGSVYISLSGRNINSLASSDHTGIKGFSQALLRAVHKTFTTDNQKSRICLEYPSLLATDCQIIESLFYLYDANGKKIENGNSVHAGDRFFVMIKPLTSLYAYVISKDSNNNLFKIFPNKQVTDIPNPLNANFQYFFPSTDSNLVFEFDDQPGTEKFYFIFSSVPLREITRYLSGDQTLEVEEFEKRILTRGIKLTEKKVSATVKLPKSGYQTKDVEELKGKGVIVKELVLKHL